LPTSADLFFSLTSHIPQECLPNNNPFSSTAYTISTGSSAIWTVNIVLTHLVIFHSIDELVEKTKYYLQHPQEREAIALGGYTRTLKEHTYEIRFNKIFQEMGLI